MVFSWRKTNGPPQAVEDAIEKKMHGAEHGNAVQSPPPRALDGALGPI